MKWRHRYHKVKHSLGQAYNTGMKILSVADRAHALAGKAFHAFGDQFDPEVQYKVAHGLDTYSKHRKTIKNVDAKLRKVGKHLQNEFPEYL